MNIVKLEAFPRVRLGHAPTPIDAAPNLSRSLGVEVHVKRDDCTGLAFGGNKVRQLEFYLGAARAVNADTVLITGAVQSNFVRLAAAGARQLGMDIHIQLEDRVPGKDATYRASGNVLLDRLLGATIHYFPEGENEAAADASLHRVAHELEAKGRRPYVIHLGVEHPPIGGLGYVVAAVEMANQMKAAGLELDGFVVPSGSGLTHAGFLVGLRALGIDLPVYGICVRRAVDVQHPRVLRRATEIATLIGRDGLIDAADVDVSDAVLAPGYGQLNDATLSAMSRGASLEALMLDPVYSARTLAGLIHRVEQGLVAQGARLGFIHTGGTPALFGYESALTEYFGAQAPAGSSQPRTPRATR